MAHVRGVLMRCSGCNLAPKRACVMASRCKDKKVWSLAVGQCARGPFGSEVRPVALAHFGACMGALFGASNVLRVHSALERVHQKCPIYGGARPAHAT